MKRRKFIQLSTLSALYLQSSITFTACGNQSSERNSKLNAVTIDDKIRTITALEATNKKLYTTRQEQSNNLLNAGSTAELFQKFQNAALSLQPTPNDLYFSQETLWQSYTNAHTVSYEQLTAQLAKLKASMRLYDYHKQKALKTALTPEVPQESAAIDSAVTTFLQTVEDFKNLQFGAVAIDGLTLSIKLVYVVLEQVKNSTAGQYMLGLVFSALTSLLQTMETKTLQNLNFSSDTNVALSIAKMAIAIISVQGLAALHNAAPQRSSLQVSTQTTASDTTQTETLLQNITLQSQLISTLLAIVNTIVNKVTTATTTLATHVIDPNYELTKEDKALIASLKPLASILGILGLIVKALLSFYHTHINDAQQSGALQGDAQNYATLFGNPINPYDTSFSKFTSQNYEALFASNPMLEEILNALGITNPNFSVQESAAATTATTESQAYAFAATVANPDYSITTNTTTQASNFATHLADLAYEFVMKIEDDAYTFAMKGMEYGYLFASKGEEVGLMADRILWMAVQIGAMADRIGEMADRIVYTEQLIVYTETLILDFGMLIYGTTKQISNFLLMGMAIIFDREWYSQNQQSEDPVLNVISDTTERMLRNMKEYESQVLANQVKLREATLKALDWIDGQY